MHCIYVPALHVQVDCLVLLCCFQFIVLKCVVGRLYHNVHTIHLLLSYLTKKFGKPQTYNAGWNSSVMITVVLVASSPGPSYALDRVWYTPTAPFGTSYTPLRKKKTTNLNLCHLFWSYSCLSNKNERWMHRVCLSVWQASYIIESYPCTCLNFTFTEIYW